MYAVLITQQNLVPEGEVFVVNIGCQTFSSQDKAFVADWVGRYIINPENTEKDWHNQPWNQCDKAQETERPVLRTNASLGRAR